MSFINTFSFNLFVTYFFNESPIALEAKSLSLKENSRFFSCHFLKLFTCLLHVILEANPFFFTRRLSSFIPQKNASFKNYVLIPQILARVLVKTS